MKLFLTKASFCFVSLASFIKRVPSLKDLVAKTVVLRLSETLNGFDTERLITQRPMFVTQFLIDDDELDLNILLTKCFLSSSFKVGFCSRSKHNFSRKGKVFRVFSNKPPMRYKKCGYDVCTSKNHIIDRMQRHDQMILLDSCIFPSNLSFFLLLIVHLIRMKQSASLSCYIGP